MRYNWKTLNKLQVGAFGEYFVKMELTMYGFQVYGTEVDDRGVDFVARYERGFFCSIQVKTVREGGYVFMRKDKFELNDDMFLALLILEEGVGPKLFIIPSKEWGKPSKLLADREYEGKKSEPEWGLNISKKNMALLAEYEFSKMVWTLKKDRYNNAVESDA